MRTPRSRVQKLMAAGALMGALAALFVGGYAHTRLALAAGNGIISTGAPQGTDLLTYFSMCRAVWRSPNAITYVYPYALYWPTPPICFQLPITLLAWLGRIIGLPLAFEVARVAGAAGAGAALGAVAALWPRGFWRRWWGIATVFGGGLFGLAAIAYSMEIAGLPGLTEPYEYVPRAFDRLVWWLPFLAQNLRLPLECLYHAIVIGSLASLAWRRWRLAWCLGAVAWMSNPFAAVALYAAVIPWLMWCTWESRGAARRRFFVRLAAWLAVSAVAGLYYGWFLNRWPLMRELHRLYEIQYVPPLPARQLALLVMPWALALIASALVPGLRRHIWGRPTWRLFGLLAIVHIILIQQSAILGPRAMQSYHYNRGYLHLGLIMVAWRVVMVLAIPGFRFRRREVLSAGWSPWKISSGKARSVAAAGALLVCISCLDQIFFAAFAATRQPVGTVHAGFARLVSRVPLSPSPLVIHVEAFGLPASYITACTPHVAYLADETMVVPYPKVRRTLMDEAGQGLHGGVAGLGVDYVITGTSDTLTSSLRTQGWKLAAEEAGLLLFQSPESNPPGSVTRPFQVPERYLAFP